MKPQGEQWDPVKWNIEAAARAKALSLSNAGRCPICGRRLSWWRRLLGMELCWRWKCAIEWNHLVGS